MTAALRGVFDTKAELTAPLSPHGTSPIPKRSRVKTSLRPSVPDATMFG